MSIVKINALNKNFGETKAIDHLSLEIFKGEIYGLLGPNGAGKSTLIKILSGLLNKNSGNVRMFGYDLSSDSIKIKQRIGVVPQELAIYNDLTASENVQFFAKLYGLNRAEAAEAAGKALEFTGLSEKAKAMPSTFSGGMKRRLNIACALPHSPELIIMDEPTVGIDPQSRNHILDQIRRLNEEGCTIIYTTHYMEEVEAVCSRTGIIDHGKLIAEGNLEELTSLVTDKQNIEIRLKNTEGIDLNLLNRMDGVFSAVLDIDRLLIECSKQKNPWPRILDILTKSETAIEDINSNSPNLETVFLALTGRQLRDH